MAGPSAESAGVVAVLVARLMAAVLLVVAESTEEADRPFPTDVHPLPLASIDTPEGLLEAAVASRSTDLVAPELHIA